MSAMIKLGFSVHVLGRLSSHVHLVIHAKSQPVAFLCHGMEATPKAVQVLGLFISL